MSDDPNWASKFILLGALIILGIMLAVTVFLLTHQKGY